MYKCVFWDLDGTLADTSAGVVNAVKYASKKMGLKELKDNEYYEFIGPPNSTSYSTHFGLSGEKLSSAISLHKEYSVAKGCLEATVYPGVIGLCREISNNGVIQVVMTLKLQETADLVVEHIGLKQYMNNIVGASGNNSSKAEYLDAYINKNRLEKGHCVLVGDSIYDQDAATACGIDFIAVTYGFGFGAAYDILTKSKYVADSVEDLGKILLEK